MEYWLPDSFNSQTFPLFGFHGSNILVRETLPPVINDNINLEVSNQTPLLPSDMDPSMQRDNPLGMTPEFWPPYIHEASFIPWIDVYFDRLHPTLPVLNRSLLFTQIIQQEHRRNPQFGAMILSLCAFSLTQPIDISERPTSSSRSDQAKILVHEATRMRTSSDFGEHPSIEAVLTSFFLFGYLFGSNQHNAARLRLREAVDLASTLGLNNPATYADCSAEEKGQWLRTYLVLSVTERYISHAYFHLHIDHTTNATKQSICPSTSTPNNLHWTPIGCHPGGRRDPERNAARCIRDNRAHGKRRYGNDGSVAAHGDIRCH